MAASETIIIEANRQIAYKQELEALSTSDFNALTNPDPPPNKWKTHIQGGLQINAGDKVQVEATMIQTKGSPDATIEFLGEQNSLNPADLLDNECRAEFAYYITNRREFACALPLSATITLEGGFEADLEYGLPDVSSYDNFRAAMPIQGLEGFAYNYNDPTNTDNPVPSAYGDEIANAPMTNGSFPMTNANTNRLYYIEQGNPFLKRPLVPAEDDITSPNMLKRSVNFKVDTGFSTPAAVAEVLTSQFQERTGTADKFEEENVVPAVFNVESGALTTTRSIGATSSSMITIPTAGGQCLYGRSNGSWSAKFETETGGVGSGYVEAEGKTKLWENLLCGDPNEWKAEMDILKSCNRAGVDASTYTRATYDTANNLTMLKFNNTFGIQVIDTYNTTDVDGRVYGELRNATGTYNAVPYANFDGNACIPLNILYNDDGVAVLKEYLQRVKKWKNIDSVATPTTLPRNAKDFEFQMRIGRADLKRTCGATGNRCCLANPSLASGTTTALASYQSIDGAKRYINRVRVKNDRNIASEFIRCRSFFDKEVMDVSKHGTPNHIHLAPESKFQFTPPSGEPFAVSGLKSAPAAVGASQTDFGCAVVPVYYKEADLPHAGLKDVPFCALVTIGANQPTACPAPMPFEYALASPQFNDHLIAKPATTQKPRGQPPSSVANGKYQYPQDSRPFDYFPFIFMGADNPAVKFDSNSDGRFSLSDLHTAVRQGNGTFQVPVVPANASAAKISMCANTRLSNFAGIDQNNAKVTPDTFVQDADPLPFISAQSGIGLTSFFVKQKGRFGGEVQLFPTSPELFKATLFSKLGFSIDQLLPSFYGQVQNQFNRGNIKRGEGDNVTIASKVSNLVYPVTTNAFQSSFLNLSVATNNLNDPTENLGALGFSDDGGNPIFASAQSDELVATELPSKLDFSYLIVYSDIIQNTQFYGGANGQQKVPAMAYISRNYSEGDFFYSFATNWTYTADQDYILTEINTNITLPNGEPAPIENNSSVIYKITKPKVLPQQVLQEIENAKQMGNKEAQEARNK